MRIISRSDIEKQLSQLTEFQSETTSFGQTPEDHLMGQLKSLKLLADHCTPADTDLLMKFLEKVYPPTQSNLGVRVAGAFTSGQPNEMNGLYLDLLESLRLKGVAHKRILNLLKLREDEASANFCLVMAARHLGPSEINDGTMLKLFNFIMLLKTPGSETDAVTDAVTDEDILELLYQKESSNETRLGNYFLASKPSPHYTNYLLSIIETDPEIKLKIANMSQETCTKGQALLTGPGHPYIENYLQFLEKLYESAALTCGELLSILIVQHNEYSLSFLERLFCYRSDDIENLKLILSLLENLAKSSVLNLIPSLLGKQEILEEELSMITHSPGLAAILTEKHRKNPDLIIRMIRNNFFSDASLRDLAPLSKVIADELLSQAAKTRDHATAIALLQEALPLETTAAGAGSAPTKPKAPLARYFELNPPRSSLSSLFSVAKPDPIAQIKGELERRFHARDAEASGTTPSIGMSSLN